MEPIAITNGSIHTYTSAPNGFWVNSYVINLPDGLIIIDTQFIISEGKNLRKLVDETHKEVLAVIITHPHPDHFNGTAELLKGMKPVPVYSTGPTAAGIKNIEAGKRAYWKPTYNEDYPDETIIPDKELISGESITIGGLELFVEDIGEGETSNTSLIFLPWENILFGADLAYHGAHPWLVEGHSGQWLTQLEKYYAKYKNAASILVGHGLPGTAEILVEQINYITKFRKRVHSKTGTDGKISDEDRQIIKTALMSEYPGYQFEGLIDMNIDGMLSEV